MHNILAPRRITWHVEGAGTQEAPAQGEGFEVSSGL